LGDNGLMAIWVRYNPTTLAVKNILRNMPAICGEPDVLVNPSGMKAIRHIPIKYWKVSVILNKVIEMLQTEKDAVDAAIEAAKQIIKNSRKDIDNIEKTTRILAILTFKEINKLRAKAELKEYTWAQFKQAFKNEWEGIGAYGQD